MINESDKLKEELVSLKADMAEHVKYLRECTYHPYDKEEQFVYRLCDIIFKHFQN